MAVLKGVKLDADLQARLETLSHLKDRSTHWMMCAAIKSYVEREELYEREKQEDMDRWERYRLTGEAAPHEAALVRLGKLLDGDARPYPA